MTPEKETAVLKGLVTRKVNNLTKRWNRRFSTNIRPRIVYFDRGTDCGYAIGSGELGFNIKYLKNYKKAFIDEIVPHEVAHAFQYVVYPNDYHHHSKNWKNLCIEMGGNGNRYHNFPNC